MYYILHIKEPINPVQPQSERVIYTLFQDKKNYKIGFWDIGDWQYDGENTTIYYAKGADVFYPYIFLSLLSARIMKQKWKKIWNEFGEMKWEIIFEKY